jgi:hypothetical protein
MRSLGSDWPANYHLTFSQSESNARIAGQLAGLGINVAVVFRTELPANMHGVQVIDGTAHDLRFLDPRGVVVGLLAKGAAKKDSSGFVQDCAATVQERTKAA